MGSVTKVIRSLKNFVRSVAKLMRSLKNFVRLVAKPVRSIKNCEVAQKLCMLCEVGYKNYEVGRKTYEVGCKNYEVGRIIIGSVAKWLHV